MQQMLIRLLGPAVMVAATLGFTMPAAAKLQFISCAYPFKADTSHRSLSQSFGTYAAYGDIQVPEEGTIKGTVLFPEVPRRRVEIVWADRHTKTRPYSVTFGPAYRTQEGVAVGLTLADLEKINGGPFTLAGFDWDYGGTVTDWKGGKLATQPNRCRLIVRFKIGDLPAGAADVSGDRDFSSDDPAMRAAKPTVSQIAIQFD